MAALWIVAYPDGAYREMRCLESSEQLSDQRRRVQLHPLPWMREALRRISPDFDVQHLKCLQDSESSKRIVRSVIECRCLGLVRISPGSDGSDAIAPARHRELEAQHDYYARPLDYYSVKADAAVELVVPRTMCHYRIRAHRSTGGIGKLTGHCPLVLGYWDGDDPGLLRVKDPSSPSGYAAVADVLASWEVGGGVSNVPVLCLPYPIAALVLNGLWSELLLLIRWHKVIHIDGNPRFLPPIMGRPLDGWPAADAAVWGLRGQHRED